MKIRQIRLAACFTIITTLSLTPDPHGGGRERQCLIHCSSVLQLTDADSLSSSLLSSLVLIDFPCTALISSTVLCERSPCKSVSLVKSGLLGGINLVSDSQPLQGLRLQSAEVLLAVSHACSPGAKVSIKKNMHAPARELAHTQYSTCTIQPHTRLQMYTHLKYMIIHRHSRVSFPLYMLLHRAVLQLLEYKWLPLPLHYSH